MVWDMPREERAEGTFYCIDGGSLADLHRIEAISRDVRVMAVGEFYLPV